jgi:hypothetical protein
MVKRMLVLTPAVFCCAAGSPPSAAEARAWAGDLSPLQPAQWNRTRAAHLLERAGFGATPEEVTALAGLTPAVAVRRVVYLDGVEVRAPAPRVLNGDFATFPIFA